MMPSDAVVVGLEDATAFGSDINDASASVVVNDGSGLSGHVVRTHADPVEGSIGRAVFGSSALSGLNHIDGVDETGLLIGTQLAHKAIGRRRF